MSLPSHEPRQPTDAEQEEIDRLKKTEAFLVMRLKSWDSFEPAPGSWAPFPIKIQPEGLGFIIAYATLEEAVANSENGRFAVVSIRITPSKGEQP